METTFGSVLKEWRGQRRMSQLDLGLEANVSARHISFLETGRAKPSQPMVMHLCETLDVPRAVRNSLLNAAGYAPVYKSRELGEEDMAHVRAAVNWTLSRHDPFPAMALDRHWVVVKANKSATMLLSGAGLSEGDSLLEAMANPATMRSTLENWQEVAQHMVARLRTESEHLGGDDILENAAVILQKSLLEDGFQSSSELPAVVPARYYASGMVLSFFSTLSQFGSAEDIALAELKIEMMFPADDATRETLFMFAGAQQSTPAN